MASRNEFARMACQRRRAVGTAIALSLLCLWNCAHPLSGKLKDTDGNPVVSKDGRINIIRLDGKERINIATLDSSGAFQFKDDIEKGTYLIEALVPGYQITSIKADLVPPAKVDLVLKKSTKINPIALGSPVHVDDSVGAGGASLAPPKL